MTYVPVSKSLNDRKSLKGKSVTAYIKLSDYCNVGCEHCYLPNSVRADKFRMSHETLENALNCILQMCNAQNAPDALIVWHGGEPLALPISELTEACDITNKFIPFATQTIQTSLIPYRTEWSPLIHSRFGGLIGSSVDFSQRKIKGSSAAYLSLWLSKVQKARSDGHTIVPGMVPSTSEIGRGSEIVDWFNINHFTRWNIDRYNSFGRSDPARPSNELHSSFLTEVFDAVLSQFRRGNLMVVNTVVAAITSIMENIPGDRWGGTCSNDFIVINPDGSTNACPDKISYERFSNVSSGYAEFKMSDKRKAWIREHLLAHQNSHCRTCQFNSFCKSGCPLTPNVPSSEGECAGYFRHLSHVAQKYKTDPSLLKEYITAARS